MGWLLGGVVFGFVGGGVGGVWGFAVVVWGWGGGRGRLGGGGL